MKYKAPSTLDILAEISHSGGEYPTSEMVERLSDPPLAIVQMPHAPSRSALK